MNIRIQNLDSFRRRKSQTEAFDCNGKVTFSCIVNNDDVDVDADIVVDMSIRGNAVKSLSG